MRRRDESTIKDVSTFVKRQHEMVARTLYTLERRVKGVPGVQDVVFQFSNWKKEKGQWVAVKEAERKEPGTCENRQEHPLSADFSTRSSREFNSIRSTRTFTTSVAFFQ